MRKGVAASAALVMLLAVGCQTAGPRTLTIPTTPDHGTLPPATLQSAADAVARARAAGAPHTAPYEFYSAEEYLRMAQRSGRGAARDFAALAQSMAEAALQKGALEDPDGAPSVDTEQATRAAFDTLTTQYRALDPDKAKTVAPVTYARATAGLSRAEYLLATRRGWKDAAAVLPGLHADLNTIQRQDTDGDKIPDMTDAAPMLPEDIDAFQDEDGAPDYDNDNDGIPDSIDRAPMAAEAVNRWHDADGAPDEYPMLDSVYFGEGSTALSPDVQGYLRGVKHMMDEWPELRLRIVGFSDSVHSDVYNRDLSQRRALVIQRFFTLLGVSGDRLATSYQDPSPADPAAGNRMQLIFE